MSKKYPAIVYRYRWVIMVVLWFAYMVAFMQRISVGPLGPFLKEDLALTSTQVGSLVSAASLGYLISVVPAGWIVDKLGVRILLIIGEFIGGLFMMGMFYTPSFEIAVVMMVFSGFGCGFLLPATTKGIVSWFPAHERATAMGINQTAINVGGIVTSGVLPVIALSLNWRYGFLLLGLTAFATGLLSLLLYHSPPDKFSSAHEITTTDTDSGSLKELMHNRDFWLLALVGCFLGFIEFSLMGHLMLYLTEELFYTEIIAGIILAVTQAGGIFGKPGSGILSDHVFNGNRRTVLIIWSLVAGLMTLALGLGVSQIPWLLYIVLFLLGITAIGWGGVQLVMVAEIAGPRLTGRATGINAFVMISGFIIGPIVFGRIVDTWGSYHLAWLTCAFLCGLCVLFLLFVRNRRNRNSPSG